MLLKKIAIFKWLVPVAIAVTCYGFYAKQSGVSKIVKPVFIEKGIAVVELFTSEGCSSCPPADKLLTKIAGENKEQVYVLSYHVDYWDYLGWKDPFSQPAFSNRQRQYAQRFSLESIYTPQVVVNGVDEFVGSDETKLRTSIAKNSTVSSINIQAKRKAETIEVSYSLQNKDALWLNIALVLPQATTTVKKGENEGKTLHHVSVVHELKTIEPLNGVGLIAIKIPTALKETAFEVIAFTQQKTQGKITGAAHISIPAN